MHQDLSDLVQYCNAVHFKVGSLTVLTVRFTQRSEWCSRSLSAPSPLRVVALVAPPPLVARFSSALVV